MKMPKLPKDVGLTLAVLYAVCLGLVVCCTSACSTTHPADEAKLDTRNKVHTALKEGLSGLGDGEVLGIIKIEKAAQLLDRAGQPQYASMLRTGEVGLSQARRKLIEMGLIEPTAEDVAGLLGGFPYVTTYTLIRDNGEQIPIGESNKVVAVDTPIAPTMPTPRIRTLAVKDIAPKIKTATDPLLGDIVLPTATNAPPGEGDPFDAIGELKPQ